MSFCVQGLQLFKKPKNQISFHRHFKWHNFTAFNRFTIEVFCNFCESFFLKLQLHGAIYRPDSFVLMLRYCAKLKAIRCESTSLNRIVADKSHRVIAA